MEALTEATLEAYDGVELRLLNGTVVRCATLTMSEATRYLRLMGKAKDDASAHAEFVEEFPVRMNLVRVRLADLGLVVEGPDGPLDFGALTYLDGKNLTELLAVASYHPDEVRRSRAHLLFLRRFPRKLGIDPDRLAPGEWGALGHSFTDEFYTLAYSLAQDFCYRLISGPRNQVMTLTRASTRDQNSNSASTI